MMEDFEKPLADPLTSKSGGAAFLERVEALKERHGYAGTDFEPARLDFVPSSLGWDVRRRAPSSELTTPIP